MSRRTSQTHSRVASSVDTVVMSGSHSQHQRTTHSELHHTPPGEVETQWFHTCPVPRSTPRSDTQQEPRLSSSHTSAAVTTTVQKISSARTVTTPPRHTVRESEHKQVASGRKAIRLTKVEEWYDNCMIIEPQTNVTAPCLLSGMQLRPLRSNVRPNVTGGLSCRRMAVFRTIV